MTYEDLDKQIWDAIGKLRRAGYYGRLKMRVSESAYTLLKPYLIREKQSGVETYWGMATEVNARPDDWVEVEKVEKNPF